MVIGGRFHFSKINPFKSTSKTVWKIKFELPVSPNMFRMTSVRGHFLKKSALKGLNIKKTSLTNGTFDTSDKIVWIDTIYSLNEEEGKTEC